MAEARPKTKLTYQDYCNTPDDERWELLNGELVMAPGANTPHQTISFNLVLMLGNFVRDRGLGHVFHPPYDVVLSDTSVLQPDLLFVSKERAHIVNSRNIRGTPDLVVEILSPSTASRDWKVKLDLYAEHGIREYWVVDPEIQRVWVMMRNENTLAEAANYGRGDTLLSPTLEGLTLDIDEVFRDLDTWS